MKSSVKKIIIKLLTAVLIIAVGILSLFLVKNYTKPNVSEDEIGVNIVIVDINDKVLNDDILKCKDQTLLELLEANYEIRYEREMAGTFLYDIGELKTDKWTTFIGIYVNDEFSSLGVDGILLYDGIKITFKETRIM